MIDGGLYDACLAEQGRRLYLPPVPIPACRREVEFKQNCSCMAEPAITTAGKLYCPDCGTIYTLLD